MSRSTGTQNSASGAQGKQREKSPTCLTELVVAPATRIAVAEWRLYLPQRLPGLKQGPPSPPESHLIFRVFSELGLVPRQGPVGKVISFPLAKLGFHPWLSGNYAGVMIPARGELGCVVLRERPSQEYGWAS